MTIKQAFEKLAADLSASLRNPFFVGRTLHDDFVDIADKIEGGGSGGSTVTYTPTLESGTECGTITIDNVPNKIYAPASGGGSSRNYSTTKQKVGTWVDGKDLYQITFTGTGSSDIDITSLHVDQIVGIDAGGTYAVRSDANVRLFLGYNNPQSANYGWQIEVPAANTAIKINVNSFQISAYALTILYTEANV